jgi:putative ubiquitin-RnfH superfamily antitoxin RatB of RatAB toxin-antitoxin module
MGKTKNKDATGASTPSSKIRIVIGLAVAAVCVCIVIFGPGLAELGKQREQADTTEKGSVTPIVVTSPGDVDDEASTASGLGPDGSDAEVSATPGLEPAEPVGAQDSSGEAGEVPLTEEERRAEQDMRTQLIGQNNAKLEKKEAELAEMEAMLDILTEMADDPDRIELYKKLIADTKDEMQGIKEQTARYEKESIKE